MHSKVMMVRPASFGYNPETAENNHFQSDDGKESKESISEKAIEEFDQLVVKLEEKGIEVVVMQDSRSPAKPDAVFPNNWVSFHRNKTMITYPMYSPLRRLEKSEEFIKSFQEDHGYKKWYTFDHYEEDGFFLEGTGSMIIDRENNFLFACLGPRTDIKILEKFCILMACQKFHFHAVDDIGQDIYHTNVMMMIGSEYAVACLDTIKDPKEKEEFIHHLNRLNKEIIDISQEQVNQFAGNMLELFGENGKSYLIMSSAAFKSLSNDQIERLEKYSEIVHSDIETIEKYGGGSARCMIAQME